MSVWRKLEEIVLACLVGGGIVLFSWAVGSLLAHR